MDVNKETKLEKERRSKRRIKICIILIILAFFVTYFSIVNLREDTLYMIGKHIAEIYSDKSFYYEEKLEGKDNEYKIIKRMGNEVYIETFEDNALEKLYFDLTNDKAWRILDDEKIILTDDYINFLPKIENDIFKNIMFSYGENYALTRYLYEKESSFILSFKSLRSKKEDGRDYYILKLKTIEGTEETYFDKETFELVKVVVTNSKGISNTKVLTYNGDVEETNLKEEITKDYTLMTNLEYLNHKKSLGL